MDSNEEPRMHDDHEHSDEATLSSNLNASVSAEGTVEDDYRIDYVDEPVEEEAGTKYRIRKIRGGPVIFDDERYVKNNETYEVSEDAYDFLIRVKDSYGRKFFEPAD